MFPYYFIRFSGPVLFVLVGLKVLSGYALVGKIPGLSWLSPLHDSRALDVSSYSFSSFMPFTESDFFDRSGYDETTNVSFSGSATVVSIGLLIFSLIYFFKYFLDDPYGYRSLTMFWWSAEDWQV